MEKVKQTETCAHPNCDCPVEMGSEYCSDYCENAETNSTDAIDCECGHPECG